MANLGATTYTTVTWTAGDTITEAKLDNMVANDQAYDSHSAQGLLLNNAKALCAKTAGGTATDIVRMNTSDEIVGGGNSVGWVEAGETWTYTSADDPTFTFTISGVDLTGKYTAGMRIKVSQATGGTKYFIITAVAFSTNTVVTIYGGTDYNLNDETISSPHYSTMKAPQGFPLSPTKWTVQATDTTQRTQASAVSGTWYNLNAAHTISIPIGSWDVQYTANIGCVADSPSIVTATLSTANNSASDADFTMGGYATVTQFFTAVTRRKTLDIESKTSYYFNVKQTGAGGTPTIYANNDGKLIINAICAYL